MSLCSDIESTEGAAEPSDATTFYSAAEKYWADIPATVNGMLGGYDFVSTSDITSSLDFIHRLKLINHRRAVDCGAGIGRITRGLLLPLFECVDMVEVTQTFLDQSHAYVNQEDSTQQPVGVRRGRVGQRFCLGLQHFQPEKAAYDLIWCQWVLGHLTDTDLREFIQRCVEGLAPGGVIVIKENVTSELDFDDVDSSYTRSRDIFLRIFAEVGVTLARQEQQQDFPSELYPVYFFALKPSSSS